MKTLTEKYRGVLNESFSKKQFVRDARMAWPQLINQFLGFEDTVNILKQKGMISEQDKMPEYNEFDNFSEDAIRRGVDAELEAMGLMSHDKVSEEDQAKAKDKALKNLKKNPLHYLNLISGESNKVDKHDKMVEPTEKNKVDTFNGMKKADLKEEAGVPTPFDDENMDALLNIMLKHVKDPNDAEAELEKLDNGGWDAISPEVMANLDRDPEFKAWYDKLHSVSEADPIPTEPGEMERGTDGKMHNTRASNHNRKMALRKIIDFLTINGHPDSGHKVGTQEALDFIRTHRDDIFSGDIDYNDINDVWHNYDEYETINRDIPEVTGVDRNMEEELSDEDMKAIEKYGRDDKPVKVYKPGDMYSNDFDYEGMLEFGMKIRLNTNLDTLQALYNSFEDVNYHRENSHLGSAIDAIKDKDKSEALDHLRNFKKAIKQTLIGFNEGADPTRNQLEEAEAVVGDVKETLDDDAWRKLDDLRDEYNDDYVIKSIMKAMSTDDANLYLDAIMRDHGFGDGAGPIDPEQATRNVNENIEAFSDTIQVVGYPKTVEDALKVIERYERDRDPVSREEAKEIIADMRATDDDDFDRNITNLIVKAFNIKLKGVSEVKDEIVKENIKAIISKVLEEGTLNEAATQELAKMTDTYGGFEGMKSVLLQLQDVVTDIESYYDKTRGKIQKAFDAMDDIRNEEGLKVGGFLAPAIEAAFIKDLRPVTRQGFTKGLDQPKVKIISKRDIDRHDVGVPNIGESEPVKATVYTPPVNGSLRENKK